MTTSSISTFRAATLLCAFLWADIPLRASVVTYLAPPSETLSSEYTLFAEGQPVPVYTARVLDAPFAGKQWDFGGPYAFANFDMSGPVTVRIKAKRSLRNTVLRPAFPDVRLHVEDEHALTITFDSPRKVSVEPDGRKAPLLLFANPLEKEPPQAGSPGVTYFGPGFHEPGKVEVHDNQTVYLAGGAVVKGAIVAQGSNIRILGRGILDGSDYEWRKGPANFTIGITGTNVEVSGITIRGSSHWTIVPNASRDVTIRNVKLCGARVQNDDGIDPCNSQNVLITDCFLRTDDDCVALKGLDLRHPNNNVENIVLENCTLWCDRARIFLLGHESRAAFMRNIALRNLDIIHFSMTAFLLEPGEEMRLEDVRIQDVRIHGEGQRELARLKPTVNQYMHTKVPGHVRGVTFSNVSVYGAPGPYLIQLEGADAQHQVQEVTLQNVKVLGQDLKANSPNLKVGPQVEDVHCLP
jgi:Glycosyl hydrolases family 28